MEFETTEAEGGDIAWDARWQFSFQAGVNELKSNSINVMLFSTSRRAQVSKLSIKLWDIATGPSQQNFAMEDPKKKVLGRVSFKALMRQETLLILRPSNINFSISPEKKGKYALAIRSVTEESENAIQLPPTESHTYEITEEDTGSCLAFPATIETLRNASLQLRLFKVKKTGEQEQVAECWLTFSKMFKQEKYTVIKRDGPGYRSFNSKKGSELDLDNLMELMKTYTVTRPFKEKLWELGKEAGLISGLMTIQNVPLMSQLISGVNTENGFMAQSSNFLENSAVTPKANIRPSLPTEISKLITLTEALMTFFSTGERREGGLLSSKGSEIRDHINKVKDAINILRESKKRSMISFIYENKSDLIYSQNSFMDLGEHLLNFADLTAYAVRPFYYEALVHVVRRGELDLGSLAVTEESEKQRNRKIPVGVRYRSFLRNLMIAALGKLKIKGVDKRSQQFTEFICAVAYFRIPEFRQVLLRILKEKTIEIREARDFPWDLESDDNTFFETHILPMFDWTNLFYQFLPVNSDEDKELKTALLDPAWKKRVAKKGIAYFRLVTEWATHVKRLFPEKHIPWQEIPGYGLIIRSFLIEMKSRKLAEYPVAMLQCSQSLLHNPDLLSLFVRLLFSKTNVYDVEKVSICFDILSTWFTHIYEESLALSLSFEESFFMQGLRVALTSDIGFNVAKAIWFLYQNFQLLPAQTRRELILDLLLRPTEVRNFTLHWSQSVRITFWNFLFFRVVSLKAVPFETVTGLEDILFDRAVEVTGQVVKAEIETLEPAQRAYLGYSQRELQATKEHYDRWLSQVQSDLAAVSGKPGLYRGLGAFPFPEMSVENALVDKSENRMQEEW